MLQHHTTWSVALRVQTSADHLREVSTPRRNNAQAHHEGQLTLTADIASDLCATGGELAGAVGQRVAARLKSSVVWRGQRDARSAPGGDSHPKQN